MFHAHEFWIKKMSLDHMQNKTLKNQHSRCSLCVWPKLPDWFAFFFLSLSQALQPPPRRDVLRKKKMFTLKIRLFGNPRRDLRQHYAIAIVGESKAHTQTYTYTYRCRYICVYVRTRVKHAKINKRSKKKYIRTWKMPWNCT